MLIEFGCRRPEPPWTPRSNEIHRPNPLLIPAPETNDDDGLGMRFRKQLRIDRGVELKDISLLELTRSVVWWLEKVCHQHSKLFQSHLTSKIYQGQKNTQGVLTLAEMETLQYINLRKAAWITDIFEEHETLRNSEDDKSFWRAYCQKLKKVRRNFGFLMVQIPK